MPDFNAGGRQENLRDRRPFVGYAELSVMSESDMPDTTVFKMKLTIMICNVLCIEKRRLFWLSRIVIKICTEQSIPLSKTCESTQVQNVTSIFSQEFGTTAQRPKKSYHFRNILESVFCQYLSMKYITQNVCVSTVYTLRFTTEHWIIFFNSFRYFYQMKVDGKICADLLL